MLSPDPVGVDLAREFKPGRVLCTMSSFGICSPRSITAEA